MENIIGISLELQKKILGLIRFLVEENRKLTGAIILIDGVGYGFCWGITDLENLLVSAEYFQVNSLAYKFSVVEAVVGIPAGELMQKIHRLTDEAELPGILNYLKSRRKAA